MVTPDRAGVVATHARLRRTASMAITAAVLTLTLSGCDWRQAT